MGESIILKSCYIESLKLAVEHRCESVAFPLISSGVYGYPKDKVLKFAIQIITDFLEDHELTVYLCVFDRKAYEFSKNLYKEISEFIDDDYAEELSEKYYPELEIFERTLSEEQLFTSASCSTIADFAKPISIQENNAASTTLGEYMKAME